MANRFELLLPDVAGAFTQGRAQVRQEDRERLADQEMRAQLDRGNQFRQLAGQAYGAQTPTERAQFISQAAAVDPQGAMAMDRQMGSNDEMKQKRLGVAAGALVKAPNDNLRMTIYPAIRDEMRSLGINAPDQYSPDMLPVAQQFLDKQQGGNSQLQYFNAQTQGMKPEDVERARRIDLGLDARQSSAGLQVREIVDSEGRKRLVSVDPRTGAGTYVDGIGGASLAEMERMKAQGQSDVDLAMKPQIAQRTAEATELGKSAAERDTVNRKNQTAYQVYQQGASNLQRAMAGTETGPIAGRVPAFTSAQQIAEGAQATMAPVLKQLFRDAGEGTFTEGDQKLLTDMLPKRTDHPEAAAAKMQMIDQLVSAKLRQGSQSPGGTQPSSRNSPVTSRPVAQAADGWSIVEE